MTYRFPVISLRKLYFYTLLSVGISIISIIIIASWVVYLFKIEKSDIIIYFIIISEIFLGLFITSRIENKLTKQAIISLNKHAIIIDDERKILIEKIKNCKIQRLAKYYPALIIYDQNNTKYVIRCADRYNLSFTELTNHLQKLVKA